MTSCVITCLGARPLYAHTDRSGECSCCFQADIGEVARSVVVAPNAAVRSARPEAVAQVPNGAYHDHSGLLGDLAETAHADPRPIAR